MLYVVYIQPVYSAELCITRGIVLLHKFKLSTFMSCQNNAGQDHNTKTAKTSFKNSANFKYV